MNTNVSLQLNTENIIAYNSNIKALRNDIYGYLTGIDNGLVELNNYVKSQGITQYLGDLRFSVRTISQNLTTCLDDLISFVDSQMSGYEETAVSATNQLREALEFINTEFSKEI